MGRSEFFGREDEVRVFDARDSGRLRYSGPIRLPAGNVLFSNRVWSFSGDDHPHVARTVGTLAFGISMTNDAFRGVGNYIASNTTEFYGGRIRSATAMILMAEISGYGAQHFQPNEAQVTEYVWTINSALSAVHSDIQLPYEITN